MNLNPATVLDPVFQFLDWIIAEWESIFGAGIGIVIQPHTLPPPPAIIIHEYHPPDDGMD